MKSDEKVDVAGPEIGCWHNQTQACDNRPKAGQRKRDQPVWGLASYEGFGMYTNIFLPQMRSFWAI